MVKFINSMGGVMLVADERAEEYKALGFKPIAEKPEANDKKPPRKRTTSKEK